MINRTFILVFILLSFRLAGQQPGEFGVSALFSDHMVLQQNMQVPVWGTGRRGSTVQVHLAGFTATTIVDPEGKWMVRLPEMNAGGPYEMEVKGEKKIKIRDVMVGEVWFASGQSNMEWTVGAGVGPTTDEEIATADFPGIRYFNVIRDTRSLPIGNLTQGQWAVCTPEAVKSYSGVAYFFAREIARKRNVAVGIIQASWGATNIESWMSAEMLRSHPDFTTMIDKTNWDPAKWEKFVRKSLRNEKIRDSLANVARLGVTIGAHLKDYNDSDWNSCNYPMNTDSLKLPNFWGFIWFRKSFTVEEPYTYPGYEISIPLSGNRFQLFINGNPVETREDALSGKKTYHIPMGSLVRGQNVLAIRVLIYWNTGGVGQKNTDALLVSDDGTKKISLNGEWKFNSAIEPEIPQRQDYNNRPAVLFNGMVSPVIPYGIRGVIWYQGEANAQRFNQYNKLLSMLINDWRIRWSQGYFPFLFVQLANFRYRRSQPGPSNWAEIREAQRQNLRLPKTGMAVAIDLGEAADIHPRNKIDVGKRLFLAAQHVAYGENLVFSGPMYDTIRIEGPVVRVSFTSVGSGLVTKDGEPPRNFAIAGEDRRFYWADATIEGNEVILSSPSVPSPVAVRYAWDFNPEVNFYNREGLPASPFRTDNWNGK